MPGRMLPLAIAAAIAVAVCSCGSTSDSSTPTIAPTATPSIDPCLVGTWKSTGVTGTLTAGGAPVSLTGGSGEVLGIAATGAIRSDDSNTLPLTGTAPDGTVYKVVQTGTATGTIASTAGKITVTLHQPNTLSVTLFKNGVQVQTQRPGSASDAYTCTAAVTLIVTSGGGTVVRYSPA